MRKVDNRGCGSSAGWRGLSRATAVVLLAGLGAGACADASDGTTGWMPLYSTTGERSEVACSASGRASPFTWSSASISYLVCNGSSPASSSVSFALRNSSARTVTVKWIEAEGASRALDTPLTLTPEESAVVSCSGGFSSPGTDMVACRPITVAWVDGADAAVGTTHGAHLVAFGTSSTVWDECGGIGGRTSCSATKAP